jgi:5-methylcytosine-specific restriction endonuclease McrA
VLSCVGCGERFEARGSTTVRHCAGCREERKRAAWAADNHRKRTRSKGLERDRILPREIFDRDGWRCHLCGRRVNSRLRAPHPGSATLDHITPVSKGGPHTRANVAIAHLSCNSAKRDRSVGEQLLLLG